MNRWLLLRGLGRESRHWGEFVHVFGSLAPDLEVQAIDLAGNGMRNEATSPISVAAMVEDARQALRERGESAGRRGPLNVLALSLGGMVALEWAARYPQEIARCVVINSSLGGISPFHQRLRPPIYSSLLRLAMSTSEESAEALMLAMTSAHHDPSRKGDFLRSFHGDSLQDSLRSSHWDSFRSQLAKQWAGFRRERPVSGSNMLRQLIAAARYRAPQRAPACPVLLLASTQDRLVNVECSRALALRYSWPLIEHPAAGHDLPLDDPRWVAQQVGGWLRGEMT